MAVESFELLEELEPRSFWFRSRNRLVVWALDEYFPRASSLLEVGCGTGFVLDGIRRARPELELTGAELYEEGLEVARRRLPDVPLLQLDAREMPFEEEFDVVGVFDVLEHIPEDEEALAGMFRATRRGGGILVTVPQHPWLWSGFDDYSHHQRRYTRNELVAKLDRAGFAVRRVTSFVSFLLPALWLARVRQRGRPYDPLADYRTGRPLDLALERVMDLERALVRAGISFPAGSSLLAVAQRP